jgi:hypothetical protein
MTHLAIPRVESSLYPRYSITFILDKERIVTPSREIAVKKVPTEQELALRHLPLLAKAVTLALQECEKDVGAVKIDVGEDEEGRRWVVIKVEVS